MGCVGGAHERAGVGGGVVIEVAAVVCESVQQPLGDGRADVGGDARGQRRRHGEQRPRPQVRVGAIVEVAGAGAGRAARAGVRPVAVERRPAEARHARVARPVVALCKEHELEGVGDLSFIHI